jgi:hypothetical protein
MHAQQGASSGSGAVGVGVNITPGGSGTHSPRSQQRMAAEGGIEWIAFVCAVELCVRVCWLMVPLSACRAPVPFGRPAEASRLFSAAQQKKRGIEKEGAERGVQEEEGERRHALSWHLALVPHHCELDASASGRLFFLMGKRITRRWR